MNNIIPSTTIGLDLGDTKHAICALNAGGEIIDERTITNHRESDRDPRMVTFPYEIVVGNSPD